jgi:hypothetical protein
VAHMREYKKVQPGYMSTFVPRCNLDMAEGYKKVQHPLKGCTLYPMAEAPRWAAIGDALWHEKPGFALDNGEWVPRGRALDRPRHLAIHRPRCNSSNLI